MISASTLRAACLVGAMALSSFSVVAASPIATEDQAAKRAIEVTRRYRLTSDKIECLAFEAYDDGAIYTVRVRETHTPSCGGIPEVSPTIYWLKLRKRDGHATINRGTGNFRELGKPRR